MRPLLEVHDLAKTFDVHQLGRRIIVFEYLSFALATGQFLLVTGANGVGKSTLLRCLYRTYRASGGQALYHAQAGPIDLARAADVDIAELRREEIGFVTQFLRPRPRVSAVELVAEPLLTLGRSWEDAEREAKHWLADFGLKADIWPAYPTTFSGGEQQKVNLARALIAPRRLLLLDEPTASLDRRAREALVRRLADLKQQGVAMLGVFHHPEPIAHLVDVEVSLEAARSVLHRNGEEHAYVGD
ncbi:MAG TPA: ATP-binding cassette domain-containing protein [Anaerolineales bacterium]|nr:ATP-binding cassette domain-containing protein [Anaerolineales bacterium]